MDIYSLLDYTKAFDYMVHNKPWTMLKEMGIPEHPTCLLRNLYAGQEATVSTWILSYLFNFYAEYIMGNARLDESQAGITIAKRNINNFRYTKDSTLMAESEEKLKSLLVKVKEESEKAGLKLNIKKKQRSWHEVPSLDGK